MSRGWFRLLVFEVSRGRIRNLIFDVQKLDWTSGGEVSRGRIRIPTFIGSEFALVFFEVDRGSSKSIEVDRN